MRENQHTIKSYMIEVGLPTVTAVVIALSLWWAQ